MDTGEGEGGKNSESSIDIYTLPRVKHNSWGAACGTRSSARCSPEGWDGGGGRQAQDGGVICILLCDSRCMAESSTTL